MVKDIKVFTRTTCSPCRMLKSWLRYKGVNYSEINIDSNFEAGRTAMQKYGYAMVPLTVVTMLDGTEEIICGYNLSSLTKLIENPVTVQ